MKKLTYLLAIFAFLAALAGLAVALTALLAGCGASGPEAAGSGLEEVSSR